MLLPIWVRDGVTVMPTLSRAFILSTALPFPNISVCYLWISVLRTLPPEMIAPAWPILRPGGAETPAMYATTGFPFVPTWSKNSAAFSSSSPPISPIRMIPFVWGSSRNIDKQSIKLVPLKGSPPIPLNQI